MKKYFYFFLVFIASPAIFLAQNTAQLQNTQQLDSVYIDAKLALDRKQSGKTITVISKEILNQNAGRSVAEVLNQVAGFELNGSQSNNGQNLGYFVRGGRNRQVLIVVDGVPLNDASQISNDYDLRLVAADNIERIEIMKGASSVLYGSGAATAVISITTQQATNDKFQLRAASMAGTDRSAEDKDYEMESIQNSLNIGGSTKHIFYQASLSHRYTDGLSAIEATEGNLPNAPDLFNAFNSRVNFGIQLNKDIKFSQFVAFDRIENGFDDFNYTDADFISSSKQFRTGGNFEWNYSKGVVIFNDSYTLMEREITSAFPAKYDSKVYSLDTYWQHQYTPRLRSVIGLNANFSTMDSFTIPFGENDFVQNVDGETASFDYYDPYLNVVFNSGWGFSLNTGVRLNIHSVYDNHLVYQLNPSYYVDLNSFGLKLMGSYSTAYITPSLFQIFDPVYGNEDLMPEENTTIEGGFELSNKSGLRFSALYFSRNEEQFIDFVVVDPELFLYQYQNVVDEFEVSGMELELSLPIGSKLSFQGNYTLTKRDDRFAIRIPEHKANASLNYQWCNATNFGLQYQFVSEREDIFFNSDTFENERVNLSSYTLLHFNASTRFTKNLRFLLSVRNILNADFAELYRYQTRGRSVQLGLQLEL